MMEQVCYTVTKFINYNDKETIMLGKHKNRHTAARKRADKKKLKAQKRKLVG